MRYRHIYWHRNSCMCYNTLLMVIDKDLETVVGFVLETWVIDKG